MDYRFLGKTGMKVSELCLGAMTFGREADQDLSFQMMDCFADEGGTFIDTADVYTRGVSEEIVGNWLQNQRREDYIIATKVRFPMGEGVNEVGLSRKHILDGVENSLRRLQVDYIDLYQVHCWDPGTPLEETLGTLHRLIESGKVRYIGVSNYTASQIQKAVDVSKMMGWEPFISLQPLYNLLDRYLDWEIIGVCQEEGIGIIPWSPLRGGWLTGKFRREMENPPEDTRIHLAEQEGWSESWSNYNKNRTWDVIDKLLEVAEAEGKSAAQVALNWVKDRPGITAPIIGARNLEQLQDNIGSTGWQMETAHREALDEISEMPQPYYPYGFIERGLPGRLRE